MSNENERIVNEMQRRGYMTATEAADRCGCAVSTVYRKVERGAVDGFKAGESGLWFVRRASLAEHYGPQVAAALGLDKLLPDEDPKAKPLPREAPAKTKPAPAKQRKGPARAR